MTILPLMMVSPPAPDYAWFTPLPVMARALMRKPSIGQVSGVMACRTVRVGHP
jgi:hypothetical protein